MSNISQQSPRSPRSPRSMIFNKKNNNLLNQTHSSYNQEPQNQHPNHPHLKINLQINEAKQKIIYSTSSEFEIPDYNNIYQQVSRDESENPISTYRENKTLNCDSFDNSIYLTESKDERDAKSLHNSNPMTIKNSQSTQPQTNETDFFEINEIIKHIETRYKYERFY